MLVWGSCHPRGEDSDFDGLFLKRDEIKGMASDLCGKPILVEHDSAKTGSVGTIHHAWETADSGMHVLFETNRPGD